jgi:NDP-sugar pyrophosphorylase family protein
MNTGWPQTLTCSFAGHMASEYGVQVVTRQQDADLEYLRGASQQFCAKPQAYVEWLRSISIGQLRNSKFVDVLNGCFEQLRVRLVKDSCAPHLIAQALEIAASDVPLIEEVGEYGAPQHVVQVLCDQLAEACLFTAGRLVQNTAEGLRARGMPSAPDIDENKVRTLADLNFDSAPATPPIPLDRKEPVLLVATAGRGTRLRTTIPKALLPLAGRPLVHPILDSAARAGIQQVIVVLKYRAELHPPVLGPGCRYVIQKEALGHGHSVAAGLRLLQDHAGPCVLAYSDTPFLSAECFRKVIEPVRAGIAGMTVLTVPSRDMPEFGHLEESGGRVRAIRQPRFGEAGGDQADGGLYAFWPVDAALALLATTNRNPRYEFSFTEVVRELDRRGHVVQAAPVRDPREVLGINRPADWIVARRRVEELRAAIGFYGRYGGVAGGSRGPAELLEVANAYETRVQRMIGNILVLDDETGQAPA